MLVTASETIGVDLGADLDLQNYINGRVFWEFADDGAALPIVTFSLAENRPKTKNGRRNYTATVRSYDMNLTKAAELSQLVEAALTTRNYTFLGARSGYSDTERQEGYIEQIFNFNI